MSKIIVKKDKEQKILNFYPNVLLQKEHQPLLEY